MTLGGLLNFVRKSQFFEQDQINKLISESHEEVPPITGNTVERRIVKQGEIRIRTNTITIQTTYDTAVEGRGRGVIPFIRKKPETVKSYPLIHVTTGTVTFPQDATTMFGGGGSFDGSTYITVTDHANLNVTDEITIAMNIIPVANTGTDLLFSKDNQYQIRLTGTNSIEFRTYSGGAWRTGVSYDYTADIGNEIIIIASYKSTASGQKLYIGTTLQDSDSLTGALNTTSNDLKICGDGTSNIPSGTIISCLTVIHNEVDATWITNYNNGILDTSDGNDEITTIPFITTDEPRPDASSGECRST